MSNVLIVLHICENELKKAAFSTASFAGGVAAHTGGTYDVLAIGSELSGVRQQLASMGARTVYLAEAADLAQGLAERLVPIVEQVVTGGAYRVVASPASSMAKDMMPRLAARIGAGMASEVMSYTFEADRFTWVRPMYAGNVNGAVQIDTPLEVVTIRPTEFDAVAPSGNSPVEALAVGEPEPVAGQVTWLGFDKAVSTRPDLAEAAVVVSGGRGLKSRENFQILEELADLLGGAVGASRAAVDSGFIHNDFQVGQTGKIVAPDLYIACGISGSLQHTAGMKSSKVVVAINKDEEAPIFQVADYGIVDDLFKVLPEMAAEIRKIRS